MSKKIIFTAFLITFLTCSSNIFAAERHVPGQYSTIQAAIDDCNDGDIVIIEPNTYTGTGNRDIDFGGLAITVRSTDPNDPDIVEATVINCQASSSNQHRGFLFQSGEDNNSIVEGLTIQGGYIYNDSAKGGGIYCAGASPTIRNCVIKNNGAYGTNYSGPSQNGGQAYGGGIYCSSSNAKIIDCTIQDNFSTGGQGGNNYWDEESGTAGNGGHASGGGIYCSSGNVEIINCAIENNVSKGGKGGDKYYEAAGNPGTGGHAWGGGIYGSSDSTLLIENCIMSQNEARGGGGGTEYDEWTGDPIWEADFGLGRGGGVYGSNLTIKNCLVVSNLVYEGYPGLPPGENYPDGAGIYGLSMAVSNSTICNNGSYNAVAAIAGNGSLINCIAWSNDCGEGDIWETGFTVTYSCFEDNVSGTGNIHTDPCFASGPYGDYYLSQIAAGQSYNSPCVNAGSDNAVNLGMDIYTTRTDNFRDREKVDMGYHYTISSSADIDGDGNVDLHDYAILALQWQQNPAIPSADISPVDGDGIVDTNDLKVLVDNWLDGVFLPASVGWWELDEISGTIAHDSADSRDGSVIGTPQWVEGKYSNALYFDGSYVTISPLYLYSNTVTMTAWINRGNNDQNDFAGIVFCRDVNTIAGFGFGTNNELRYNWNSTGYTWNPGLTVPPDVWTFTALVVEPDRATLYLYNGATLSAATNMISNAAEEFDGALCIGREQNGSHPDRKVKATIDDVRIYDRALSGSEIEQLCLFGGL